MPPKLALIRELFSPTGAKGQQPTAAALAAPAAPTPVATKPAPTLPAPVVAKPVPAPPVAAAAPIVATTPAPKPAATPAPASTDSTGDAEAAVLAWAKAWAARDMKGYLAAYAKDFDTPGSMSRKAWEEERRQRITTKSKITVKLENLVVTTTGNNTAVAKFRQDYKANDLSVSSRKTLNLVKVGDRWQIVKESTGT